MNTANRSGIGPGRVDRIVMHVVHVPLEVKSIADGVFPETALPDGSLLAALPGKRSFSFAPSGLKKLRGKLPLDSTPAHRIVGISWGKRPDCMEVVREKD